MRKLNRTLALVAALGVGAVGLTAGQDVAGTRTPSSTGVETRILHPMPPLGDIDCCHVAKISAEDDWETPVVFVAPRTTEYR